MAWPHKRRTGWKWALLAVIAGPPTFIVFCNLVVYLAGAWRIEEDVGEVPAADLALILGAAPASGAVQERLLAGLDLWRSGRVSFLLVSGGGDGTAFSETAYMERFLKSNGVPDDAIMVDSLGLRTLDSVKRARDVFGVRRVVLVSQRYHLYRAVFLARISGMEAHGYAARGGPEIDSRHVRSREFFARVQAVLDALVGRRARYPDAPPTELHLS